MDVTMEISGADLGRGRPGRGMPAALLECLAAMRIGAETALELEFAEHAEGRCENERTEGRE
jgi:hypothetical protein